MQDNSTTVEVRCKQQINIFVLSSHTCVEKFYFIFYAFFVLKIDDREKHFDAKL